MWHDTPVIQSGGALAANLRFYEFCARLSGRQAVWDWESRGAFLIAVVKQKSCQINIKYFAFTDCHNHICKTYLQSIEKDTQVLVQGTLSLPKLSHLL